MTKNTYNNFLMENLDYFLRYKRMKRLQIYKLIAILLPLIILVAIELYMRIGNYGYNTQLFISDQDTRFWVMNRDISKKYFTISQNATIGNQETFYKEKPPGTLRFFVLGASSAIGFPYMHNGAFPRMLKYKLQFLLPENNIEIINVSLTAINTYTLYDFSKQIVNYQPDGILIYAGHNEYYGALGVASTSRIGRNSHLIQLALASKELKLVQELNMLTDKLGAKDPNLINPDRTLMERMAAHQLIPYQSGLFTAGVEQFDRNLRKIFTLYKKHQIPVFIGTLAGNLKGQAPLSNEDSDPYNAPDEYTQGEQAYQQTQYTEALQHYMRAKDYDPLRFRAPDIFNQIIRRYTNEFDNVHVVDVYQIFANHSPNGIIGNELLLEHVHPNLTGHKLIAETFYQALANHFFPARNLHQAVSTVNPTDYPTTVFDSIYGDLTINQLRQQWPFNEVPSTLAYDKESFEYKTAEAFFHQQINWGQAMQRINNHYILAKDDANALRVVEQMCLELPHEKIFLQQAGSLSIRLGMKEKADYYFKKAQKYD